MNGTEERDPAVRRFLAGIAARHEPPEAAVTPPPPYTARHRKTWRDEGIAERIRTAFTARKGGRRGA